DLLGRILRSGAHHPPAADAFKRGTQLRLEHYDQRDEADGRDVVEQPLRSVQVQLRGNEPQAQQQRESPYDVPGPRVDQQAVRLVKKERDYEDVEQVRKSKCVKEPQVRGLRPERGAPLRVNGLPQL